MRSIRISDISMKQKGAAALTFREKLDLAKLLDRLGADVIETPPLLSGKAGSLLVKSMAASVKNAVVAVPAGPSEASADEAWEAVKGAARPRLQVVFPVSTVQMEYIVHAKAPAVASMVSEAVSRCRALCGDVEFIADDATRAEPDALKAILSAAIEAGAGVITLCDNAGDMLPDELSSYIDDVYGLVPELRSADLAVSLCDKLSAAAVCAFAGALSGAAEIKAAARPEGCLPFRSIASLFTFRGEENGLSCNINTVEINRILEQIDRLFTQVRSKSLPFEGGVRESREDSVFTAADSMETILRETAKLGYDLSDEDAERVYDTFKRAAEKKKSISAREIDAIVASAAVSVPAAYKIENYVINSGNMISATAHLKLLKDGKVLESVSMGDGPIDAAFMAIEQITGRHYELDDFQIQAVTEGRAAMGEAVVKLRSGGKLYSGRGISTDIIASSIQAYVSALNKIAYEEENA